MEKVGSNLLSVIMLFSIAIASIGYFIFASAESLWVLFFSRMLSGFGNANLGTAQAIISDSTTGEDRAKGMGLIGAAFGLGFIFGPAIGAFLSQISPRTPLYFAGVLSAFNFVLTYLILPETRKKGSTSKNLGFLLRLEFAIRHSFLLTSKKQRLCWSKLDGMIQMGMGFSTRRSKEAEWSLILVLLFRMLLLR